MSKELKHIQSLLKSHATAGAQAFFDKIVPGSPKIYGVKTPVLNQLVRQFAPGGFELANELWVAGALEEKILAVKILEKTGKKDPARLLKEFRLYAKDIDSWAVCDALGMQLLRGIVKTHADEIFKLAEKYSLSKDPWQRRLSLVMIEWYTRDTSYHDRINKIVSLHKNDEEYYVKKAVSWILRNLEKGR